ncbi:DNA replication protein psf2, partial [Coelomomyces lativittatus]
YLQDKFKEETTNDEFSALHFHFNSLSKLIFESAREDIPDATQVQSLLQDLREARRSKVRQGAEYIDLSHIRVDNLGWMEINELRPTFSRTFEVIKQLQLANHSDGLYSSQSLGG